MFSQQNHEFENEQSEGAPVEQTKAADNKEHAPANGYEFVLAVLGWIEKNWFFLLIALSTLAWVLIQIFGKK